MSENARHIAAEGKELYQRITPFFRHLNSLRRHIDQTVESYNQSIGSLERRILPSVQRLQALDVGDGELDAPQTIDQRTRSITHRVGVRLLSFLSLNEECQKTNTTIGSSKPYDDVSSGQVCGIRQERREI